MTLPPLRPAFPSLTARACILSAALAPLAMSIATSRAESWIGAFETPGLWTESTNWDTGLVPDAVGVFVNNGGISVIDSEVPDITTLDVGIGFESLGGVLEIAEGGSLTVTDTGPDGFRVGTENTGVGAIGILRLTGGTLNHLAGESRIGLGFGSQGVLEISGGTATLANMRVGLGGGANGTVNQSGGTLNVTDGELFISQGASVGVYNLSGTGVLNATNRLQIGRDSGSNGTFNQSGGTVILGNRIDLGEGDNTTLATYNMQGGTLDMVTSNTDSRILVGAFNGGNVTGAVGVFTQTGGLVRVQQLVATENTGTTGTINLNGGVLEVNQIHTGQGAAFLNFDGGTVRATGGGDLIFGSFATMNIGAGGATIDSNDQVVSIALTLSGVGGLTKQGGQALTLAAATNTYAGGTVVLGGGVIASSFGTGDITIGDGAFVTLTLNTSVDDMALIVLEGVNSVLNLDYSGTEVIGSLIVNGEIVEAGTYTIAELTSLYGAQFASLTGDAILDVTTTAVPEPSTLALLVLAVTAGGIAAARRQRA